MSSSVGGGESDSDVSVGRGDETYQPMAEDVFRYALRLASRKHTHHKLASVPGSSPAVWSNDNATEELDSCMSVVYQFTVVPNRDPA